MNEFEYPQRYDNRRKRKMNFRSDKYITVGDIYIQVG